MYASLEQCCPALYLERAPVSVLDLRSGQPLDRVHVYQPRAIILAQLAGMTSLNRRSDSAAETEQLSDLIAYGAADVWEYLNPGVDQHVTSLSLYARYHLSELVDPKDAAALGKALGLEGSPAGAEDHPGDNDGPVSIYSVTDELLGDWTQSVGAAATIRALHKALHSIQRPAVIDALLTLTPLYRYVSGDNNNDLVLEGHQGQGHHQRPKSQSPV